MADINVERRNPSVWPWILGLIVLALLIWALVTLFNDDGQVVGTPGAEEPVMVEEPIEEPAPPAGAVLPVSQIAQDPSTYAGQTVSGEVEVAEVESDRGFWAEEQGQRVFVLVRDADETAGATGGASAPAAGQQSGTAPGEAGGVELSQLRQGQRVHLNNATVHDAEGIRDLDAEIDADLRSTLEAEDAILVVDRRDIHPVTAAGSGSGLDTGNNLP